ncbi:MAG: PEP-utilizing enzyme [archaeon]
MNKEELIKQIKSRGVNKQNSKTPFIVCAWFFNWYVRNAAKLRLNSSILSFQKGDYFWQHFFLDEMTEIGKYLYEKVSKEGVKEIIKKQKSFEKEAEKLFNINLEKLSGKELESLFAKLDKLYFKWYEMFLLLEDKGEYFEKKAMESFKGTSQQLYDITHPPIVSDIIRLHQLIMKEALSPGTVSFENFKKEFYWVRTTYLDTEEVTESYFKKRIKEEKKKGEKAIRQELSSFEKKKTETEKKQKKLKKLETKETKLLRELIILSDSRKTSLLKSFHLFFNMLSAAAKKLNISLKHARLLFPKELLESLKKGKLTVSKKELEKRALSFMELKGNNINIWYGKDAEELFNACQNVGNEVKGMPACKGKVKGKVRVVLDYASKEFKEGEILVTSMTRPEFVPLMRKAKAVVTDEGGIACHAAIISRELNLPCIIGTKNGTLFLKTGDMVEVDANKGVVKKL